MSVPEIQLIVTAGTKGKKFTAINIQQDASIEELLEKISAWNGIDVTNQRVLFTRNQLQITKDGKKQYLGDYKLQDRSQLFVVHQVIGGNGPESTEQKQLDDDVELTDAQDMITWDDDPQNQRAKMPCGHAIGPESLTAYCRSLLSAGKYQFMCPYVDTEKAFYCGEIWDYTIVRKLAVLTDEEKKEFEIKISQNYIRKAAGIQECPKCSAFCVRDDPQMKRVICPCCRKDGTMYEFCWNCLGKWNNSGIKTCGNTACTGEDPRLQILKKASLKEIVGLKDCPCIRACPECGMLIQHVKACKQMKCICGQKFCFICLKKADASGKYQCGTYNSHCSIAPVQEKIPGA